jgi:hypothetical protein
MIKYGLICKNEHEFEAWFRDSAAFDDQADKGKVLCPECGSRKVSKGLMAPNVSTARKKEKSKMLAGGQAKFAKMLSEFRVHVEKTHDYVGEKFPEEARKIHYGESEDREIYGEASLEEAKDLVDEGIPVAPLPGSPKKQN